MRTHRLHQKLRSQLFLSSWITLLTCPSLLSWQQEHRQRKGIYTLVNNSSNWSWKDLERKTNLLLKCRAWHFPFPNAASCSGLGTSREWRWGDSAALCGSPIPPCWDLLPLCLGGTDSETALPLERTFPKGPGAIPNIPDVLLLRGTRREPSCPWAQTRTELPNPSIQYLGCPAQLPAQELSAQALWV